jgi:hypothetical protein
MLRVEAEAELGMLKLFLVRIAYELNNGTHGYFQLRCTETAHFCKLNM